MALSFVPELRLPDTTDMAVAVVVSWLFGRPRSSPSTSSNAVASDVYESCAEEVRVGGDGKLKKLSDALDDCGAEIATFSPEPFSRDGALP